MAIDFISKKQDEKEKRSQKQDIIMHTPEKEAPVEKVRQKMSKTTLILLFIFVIIILSGGIFYYLNFMRPKTPVSEDLAVVESEPEVLPDLQPISEPEPVVEPEPEPEPESEPAEIILPDTELAPIKGSVVKFSGSNALYLIEDNGELRLIDLDTVRFDNGQRITEISDSLVYTIAAKWKTIRKGKDVFGLVDWDPRVLSEEELKPFL